MNKVTQMRIQKGGGGGGLYVVSAIFQPYNWGGGGKKWAFHIYQHVLDELNKI